MNSTMMKLTGSSPYPLRKEQGENTLSIQDPRASAMMNQAVDSAVDDIRQQAAAKLGLSPESSWRTINQVCKEQGIRVNDLLGGISVLL